LCPDLLGHIRAYPWLYKKGCRITWSKPDDEKGEGQYPEYQWYGNK
jgi:hypothetical protein